MALELRTAIVRGELVFGEQVNQELWAKRLSVSRAALREGLKLLSAQGALEHEEFRGFYVATLNGPVIGELYWLRIAIERQVILATRLPDDAESAFLEATVQLAVAAYSSGRVEECIAADRDFYFGIYDLSRLTFLRDEAKRLWELATLVRAMTTTMGVSDMERQRDYRERRRVQLAAVRSGDRYRLVESILGDRRRVIVRFNEDLATRGDPFDPLNP